MNTLTALGNNAPGIDPLSSPTPVASDLQGRVWTRLSGGSSGGGVAAIVAIEANEIDNVDPSTELSTAAFLFGCRDDGAQTADRVRVLSFPNADAATQQGVLAAAKPAQWNETVLAAEDVQASINRAAPGAGLRHIIQGFEFTLSGVSNSPQDLSVRIRDGAGGTIIWQSYIYKDVGTNSVTIAIADLSLALSDDTDLQAEFSGAAGAATFQSINVRGITVD